MSGFLTLVNDCINTFGAAIIVPVILYIIARVMGVPNKKAMITLFSAAVGLEGFNLLINSYSGIISPVISQMVTDSGLSMDVFDLGWQAVSIVAYSTQIGMLFLALCIVLQLLLYFTRITNVFQASDLWNNYSYMIWGSLVYVMTKNTWLAMGCMLTLLMITTILAEIGAKRWSTYYNYPGCAHASLHAAITIPFAMIVNWICNKLGMYKLKASPADFQKKFGFLGEPMTLGALVGFIIGFIGNLKYLNTLAGWGSIALCTVATSTIVAVFPRVASLFANAFTPLMEGASKIAHKTNKRGKERGQWYLAINDAANYGETCTLICGIICMPLIFILAFILPGNHVLPVLSLTAIPYLIVFIVPICNGNMPKVIVTTMVYLIISLYVCTALAEPFTEVALSVGLQVETGILLVAGYSLMGSPISFAVTMAWASGNPLWIVLTIALTAVVFALGKIYKPQIIEWMEKEALCDEYVPAETPVKTN